ncbi:uncharacterized protein [Lolium perenne]|uniref:uncharacterized protein n=1 Tax=Lolium perenne TaxID=4522 RepID=UPI003A99C4CA
MLYKTRRDPGLASRGISRASCSAASLGPSHVDRVRFGAVCCEWRSADTVLPPQFPWIALPDRTFYSLPGSAFQPLPPINLSGHRRTHAQSSCGEWLVFQRHDGAMTLVSPFSTITTMVLPGLPSMWKLVVCRGNNLVAAIAGEKGHPRIFLCRPGAASWALVASGDQQLTIVKDIIFYRGKLYVLSYNHGLFSLCVDQGTADPSVSRVDRAIENLGRLKPPNCYLVESGGALLVIQRVDPNKVAEPLWPLLSGLDTEMSTKFNVFVADFEKSRWKIKRSIVLSFMH